MNESQTPEPDNLAPPSSRAVEPGAAISAGWERATFEKLMFATLAEQRSARRWRIFFRLAWLVLFAGVLWALLHRVSPTADTSSPHTAVIEIKGEIAAGADTGAEEVVAAMKTAFEDSGAQAVVLLINSPGGSPVQAGIIYDEIKRLRGLNPGIPMYAVVEDLCASGGYYIAAAADKIYVDKASIVGSIGVIMDGWGFTGTMEKLGVERRVLTSGENKAFLDPFSPEDEKQKKHALTMLNEIHQQFIDVVRKGRGKRLKENPDLFSGLMWTGAKSIELGLSDGFGSIDFVAREVIKAEDIVDYTQKDNLAERFAKRFGATMARALASLLLHPEVRLR
jgi:protease IV